MPDNGDDDDDGDGDGGGGDPAANGLPDLQDKWPREDADAEFFSKPEVRCVSSPRVQSHPMSVQPRQPHRLGHALSSALFDMRLVWLFVLSPRGGGRQKHEGRASSYVSCRLCGRTDINFKAQRRRHHLAQCPNFVQVQAHETLQLIFAVARVDNVTRQERGVGLGVDDQGGGLHYW